jgi:hypothetical protein
MQTASSATEVRILFIGNSYTSRNNLPRLLADLAAVAEHPRKLHVEAIVAGGASLRRHWNAGKARHVIANGKWDYVVLQEQSTLPVKNSSRYHDNVRLFAAEIATRKIRPVLYLTWARQNAPESQEVIARAVTDIAAEVNALVVPVGMAWQMALRKGSELRLYTEDGSHPTAAGSYLAASVFHVALFGELVEDDSVAIALKLDHATARRLRAFAWACRAPATRTFSTAR